MLENGAFNKEIVTGGIELWVRNLFDKCHCEKWDWKHEMVI